MFHIGMLTLKDEATPEQRTAITSALQKLVGQLPGLVSARTAIDQNLSEGTAGLIFMMEFDSADSWQSYRSHEAHVAVINEHIAPVLKSKTFVQVEDWEAVSRS